MTFVTAKPAEATSAWLRLKAMLDKIAALPRVRPLCPRMHLMVGAMCCAGICYGVNDRRDAMSGTG
jgi:hypothetical protein